MKRINNWKTVVFAAIVPLLIASHPVIAFACDAGSHTGCAA